LSKPDIRFVRGLCHENFEEAARGPLALKADLRRPSPLARFRALFSATMFMAFMPPCYAGPCLPQIDAMQAQIDAKLNARAAAGPEAKESAAATKSRQPTPKSIAAAEVRLGDISEKTVQAVGEAMARARKADLSGDTAGCNGALAEARKALNY
jgi:hypothetical protein